MYGQSLFRVESVGNLFKTNNRHPEYKLSGRKKQVKSEVIGQSQDELDRMGFLGLMPVKVSQNKKKTGE